MTFRYTARLGALFIWTVLALPWQAQAFQTSGGEVKGKVILDNDGSVVLGVTVMLVQISPTPRANAPNPINGGTVTVTPIAGSGGTSGAATTVTTTPAADHPDFAMKVRARQAEVKVGAEIWIEIVSTNTSGQKLLVSEGNLPPLAEWGYKTYVRDEKGDLAPETKEGRMVRTGKDEDHPNANLVCCVGSSRPLRELHPGETMKDEIILNRLYDMSRPGKYTVQVMSGDENVPGKLAKSNTITLTVTARQAPE